ncbi:hypothetical protein M6D81_24605 [Paenibacillus sp. J5C_2022]|uniref:hypothetical protein n=1 Tax=Paenibacillus sp. J5C2022 TaxID=2977129 RepID=UPI0021D378D7|nr:hypothetical protein [Paenibacillus sp. J5C2022]MCU6711887.1 hypothetical protein [Paenibacillus sp. J5C2022]
MTLPTRLTYRQLAMALSALTSKEKDRLDALQLAYERGLFPDLRLLSPALELLEDKGVKVSEYASEYILPAFGRAVLPYVEDGFHMKGKKLEANKLLVIAAVRDEEVDDLVLQCVKKGSSTVRKAAVRSMSGKLRFQQELIAQTSSRNSGIQEEAFRALAECQSELAVQHILNAYMSKANDVIDSVIRSHRNPQLDEKILQYMHALLDRGCEWLDDEGKQAQGRYFLQRFLLAMRDRSVERLHDFFRRAAEEHPFVRDLGWHKLIYDEAVRYSRLMGSRKELELMFVLESLDGDYMLEAVPMAFSIFSQKEFYEHYIALLNDKRTTGAVEQFQSFLKRFKQATRALMQEQLAEVEDELYRGSVSRYYGRWMEAQSQAPCRDMWDERWLDWAIEHDDPVMVGVLARPDHEGCRAYMEHALLLEQQELSYTIAVELLLLGMVRARMESECKWEAIMRVIEHPDNTNIREFSHSFIYIHADGMPSCYRERLEERLSRYRKWSWSLRQVEGILNQMNVRDDKPLSFITFNKS